MQSSLTRNYNTTERETTMKEKVVLGLLAAAGVTTVFVLGRNFIRKAISDKTETKSFEDGTPETLAKQMKMAFDNDGWWGTDTKLVREVLTRIRSKAELDQVHKAYGRLYNADMYRDMSKELQSSEYKEMLQIVAGKPEKSGQVVGTNQFRAWAQRLKAAFDKTYGFMPGTDEAAIKAVFMEIPSRNAFINVGKAYYKEYNANLITDLKSELEFYEYNDYMKTITSKPQS